MNIDGDCNSASKLNAAKNQKKQITTTKKPQGDSLLPPLSFYKLERNPEATPPLSHSD